MKVTSDGETTIGILYSLPEYTRKFILAHELGHVVKHSNNSTTFYRAFMSGYDIPKIEAEANKFAFYLLLNNLDINESFNKYDFVKSYGLPEELARFVSI